MMQLYRVEARASGEALTLTIDDAEALLGVDRDEIERATAEAGEMVATDYVVTVYPALPLPLALPLALARGATLAVA